jgi:hypothetical protein
MSDLYLLTSTEFPERMYGAFENIRLEKVSQPALVAIEDFLFRETDDQIKLPSPAPSAIVITDAKVNRSAIEETLAVVQFGLALLADEGLPSMHAGASISGDKCTFAQIIPGAQTDRQCRFADRINSSIATQWLKRCLAAHKTLQGRLHIAAHRYIRYAKSDERADALLDLCISLESLLDVHAEISFQFATCLAKVAESDGNAAMELADVLRDLYDLRSRIVHGDHQIGKKIKQLESKLPALHKGAKKILTRYILYASEHSREDWKLHLRSRLFTLEADE